MTGQTNIFGKIYIAVDETDADVPTFHNADLNKAQFEALDWEELPEVGQMGETGVDEAMVSYPVWGRRLAVKQKGNAEGQEPELRMLLPKSGSESDGLKAILAASATQNNVAIRIVYDDDHVEYNRGIVRSPSYPKGENQAFREIVFGFGLNQLPVLGVLPV